MSVDANGDNDISTADTATHFQETNRKNRKHKLSPLQRGILDFCTNLDQSPQLSISLLPRRYTLYSSLLLLPINFPECNEIWSNLYSELSFPRRKQLFTSIAAAFEKNGHRVSHIAVNAPIAQKVLGTKANEVLINNVTRSPSDLLPVYGNWGPTTLLDATSSQPTDSDFDAAFWVSTKQTEGITQTWAPRWTMFSRGNLSEKERILGIRRQTSPFSGLENMSSREIARMDVIDLYVGIGYFALCYLAKGVNRVWGWDLNGWSVEGLRRGCAANGWICEVVQLQDDGLPSQTRISELVETILATDQKSASERVRCVAFRGDNCKSSTIMSHIQQQFEQKRAAREPPHVRHVNLGLLPSSHRSWLSAVQVLSTSERGWLHVHENVQVDAIKSRAEEIASELKEMAVAHRRAQQTVNCMQIERVKSYAPGVMHCVFDMELSPSQINPTSAGSGIS